VVPAISYPLTSGLNSVPFTMTNASGINITSGVLQVSLADPDRVVVDEQSQSFSIGSSQSILLNIPLTFPSLKFGTYSLTLTQSDETRHGRPAAVAIPNQDTFSIRLDKTSYKIGETADVTISLTATRENSGRKAS